MNDPKTPNPGSDEALALGCLCPVMDNAHGQGYGDPNVFWYNLACPLHKATPVFEGGPT